MIARAVDLMIAAAVILGPFSVAAFIGEQYAMRERIRYRDRQRSWRNELWRDEWLVYDPAVCSFFAMRRFTVGLSRVEAAIGEAFRPAVERATEGLQGMVELWRS